MSSPPSGPGRFVDARGIDTHFHEWGSGFPTILIHGSGPAASALRAWTPVAHALSSKIRLIAPDLLGFGQTHSPRPLAFDLDIWVDHLVNFLDAVSVERANLVGASFGGALALATAIRIPKRVMRVVVIGSLGASFDLSRELDDLWGYTPSKEGMRNILQSLTFNKRWISDDFLETRYSETINIDAQKTYAALFPSPRQRWVDAMTFDARTLASITQEVLIVHGQQDKLVPIAAAFKLFQSLPAARLYAISRCGHWPHIEYFEEFVNIAWAFLSIKDNNEEGIG